MHTRVIAIDWSGAIAGARRKIWLAEVSMGSLVRLESGRDRDAVAEHLIAEAARDSRFVVGLDFAFSLPAWFLERRSLASAHALWALADREAEAWLAGSEPSFWGRRTPRPELEGMSLVDVAAARGRSLGAALAELLLETGLQLGHVAAPPRSAAVWRRRSYRPLWRCRGGVRPPLKAVTQTFSSESATRRACAPISSRSRMRCIPPVS